MGYQPDRLFLLPRTFYAGEELPFYVFVTRGASEDELVVAGVGDRIMGVTVPDEKSFSVNAEGETSKRESYLEGEMPLVAVPPSICYVRCGEALEEEARVVADANGEAVEATIVSGIAAETELIAGTMLDSGADGDLARIDMSRRL